MVTELGGAQISSLLETLPGIAQVLRSPVADAFVVLIRQASRHADFQVGPAEEVLKFSVRRNLMSQDESDRILAEVREGLQRRAERAADRAEARKPVAVKLPAPKAPAPRATVKAADTRSAARPKPKAPVKAKAARPVRKPKPAARPAAKAVRGPVRKKAPARKR